MIKIIGKDYEVYVNENKMINIYYDKKSKIIHLKTESNSDEKECFNFRYENVEGISQS